MHKLSVNPAGVLRFCQLYQAFYTASILFSGFINMDYAPSLTCITAADTKKLPFRETEHLQLIFNDYFSISAVFPGENISTEIAHSGFSFFRKHINIEFIAQLFDIVRLSQPGRKFPQDPGRGSLYFPKLRKADHPGNGGGAGLYGTDLFFQAI